MRLRLTTIVAGLLTAAGWSGPAEAIPYFARKYDVRCAQCHTLPPSLNAFGLRFVAGGYRAPELRPAMKTPPLAVWVTQRAEFDQSSRRSKGYPNRIEIISSDTAAPRLSYFLEWRALSYQTTATQRLLARHGRFEDVFLQFTLPRGVSLAVGQFRMLAQWDVSRRLSLSEPVAFAAAVGGPRALDSRLSSLRGFSWSGRAPALRATIHMTRRDSPSDGWFHELVLPLSGELSAPLGEEAERNASFALEARPKGLVYETYFRRSLSSVGAGVFVGEQRWTANLTGVLQTGGHSLLASVGTARFRDGHHDFRLTVGDTWTYRNWLAAGLRLDHQSAARRHVALIPHLNFSWPASQHSFLLTLEQRFQRNNHGMAVELSAVF